MEWCRVPIDISKKIGGIVNMLSVFLTVLSSTSYPYVQFDDYLKMIDEPRNKRLLVIFTSGNKDDAQNSPGGVTSMVDQFFYNMGRGEINKDTKTTCPSCRLYEEQWMLWHSNNKDTFDVARVDVGHLYRYEYDSGPFAFADDKGYSEFEFNKMKAHFLEIGCTVNNAPHGLNIMLNRDHVPLGSGSYGCTTVIERPGCLKKADPVALTVRGLNTYTAGTQIDGKIPQTTRKVLCRPRAR